MGEFSLHFSPRGDRNIGRYRLMELPKELVQILENDVHNQITIRGKDDDDAVLCTADRTYSIRAVMVSNSFCVVTPPGGDEPGDGIIQASIDHILELTPSVPKLHRLRGLLRGCEYDEEGDDRVRNRRMLAEIKSELQASDAELEKGLKDMHVLVLDDELRQMTPAYLNNALELVLNCLVALSLPYSKAPIADIAETLHTDHDIAQDVVKQLLCWFGSFYPSSSCPKTWSMDVVAVVKQLGLGILNAYRNTPVSQEELVTKWRSLAGDAFESHVDLTLLKGNYIYARPSATATASASLSYFPSSELPVNPADRFAELFLVQAKWKTEDITPFLDDIAIDRKDRDKLLMKFTRNVTDKEGTTYCTSRGGTIR